MNIHFVIHESFETPGAILDWALNRDCTVTYTELYKGDTFPENTDFDYLIVMGGPQSPDTKVEDCPHFNSKKEIDFIRKAIDADKYLLGVCLGSQLIGEALGATYEHSPNREVGVFPITLTEAAKTDPVFCNFNQTFDMGHWHGDMPGLTDTAVLLAYSAGCPRQVVKYTDKIYGFQCHFEFTPEAIEGMIANSTEELEKYRNLPYVQNAETLRSNNYKPINEKLFVFLDYMKNQFETENK